MTPLISSSRAWCGIVAISVLWFALLLLSVLQMKKNVDDGNAYKSCKCTLLQDKPLTPNGFADFNLYKMQVQCDDMSTTWNSRMTAQEAMPLGTVLDCLYQDSMVRFGSPYVYHFSDAFSTSAGLFFVVFLILLTPLSGMVLFFLAIVIADNTDMRKREIKPIEPSELCK